MWRHIVIFKLVVKAQKKAGAWYAGVDPFYLLDAEQLVCLCKVARLEVAGPYVVAACEARVFWRQKLSIADVDPQPRVVCEQLLAELGKPKVPVTPFDAILVYRQPERQVGQV